MKSSVIIFLVLIFAFSLYPDTDKEQEGDQEIKMIIDEEVFNEGYLDRQKLHYESIVKEFLDEIQSLIRKNIEERRKEIERKYEPVIARELEKEAQSRMDAIVLFEEFVRKYPDNSEHTPGAMYRLAELYYERSVIEQEKKMLLYEDSLVAFERKEIPKEPVVPIIDFSPTINLYRQILERFEDFKYMGAVYYMLGYCLAESGEEEEAVKVWLELLEKDIETPYLAELNLRIGEYYFNSNQLSEAEKYFEEGVKYRDSDFFDKILYKLAWSYYRQNFFEKAVDSFTELIFFADEMKSQGIDRGQDLRKEAVQYISISFADEEWGSVDKAIKYFTEDIDGANFEKDVFEQLGKYYGENSYFVDAEKAYRFILDRHPFYENAPRIHNSMIRLMYQAREFDKASAETARFAKIYGQESEWVRVNRGNATVVKEAGEWAKEALLNTAGFHHKQAQALRQKGEEEQALDEYKAAAVAYGEYLVKFPYTSDSYDITFSFADTLFYSGDVEKAVVVYERIRDDENQDKNREDAAYQTFVCYNMLWERSEESKIKGSEKRGKPFSLIEKKLIESGDIYFQVAKEIEGKPAIAYNAARIFFDHGEFEEAEKRYLSIISEFPQNEVAILAARDIISAYTENEDWVGVARWSKILSERLSPSETESRGVAQEFTTYRAGALFMYAQKLEDEKKYREAAAEYLRIVEENPYNENADKALSNAAINYQRSLMFESALQLHERIYKEYPYSDLAPQSLFLVGSTAERSFDFEKAVDAYKLLYEKYPSYERKNDAIYNAGFLLERLKKYKEAAKFYRLYYNEEKDKQEGKEALYLAGSMYWKAEDWRAMIKSSQDFIATFSNDPEVAHLVMRSYYQIAKVYEEKLNNWKQAKKTYEQIVEYFESNEVKSEEAILYVAEAKFKLVEEDFNAYVKLKVGGKNEKALEESYIKKKETIAPLVEQYSQIMTGYPAAEWVLASMYQIGYILQNFSTTLMNSEPPPGMDYEEEEMYFAMLEKEIMGFEDRAVDYYSRGLERARELKVFNKWTQLMTDRLSSLRGAQYSFGKIPLYSIDKDFESGFPLAISLNKVEKVEYQQAGIAEEKKKEKKENANNDEDQAEGEKE
jgi:cellulose synthase operon protein C